MVMAHSNNNLGDHMSNHMSNNPGANMNNSMSPHANNYMGPNIGNTMGSNTNNNLGPNAGNTMGSNANNNLGPNVGNTMGSNANNNLGPNVGNTMGSNMNNVMSENKNNYCSPMSGREKLLMTVQAYEFALVEVGLFLNTHPHDQTALAYFKQYRELKHRAVSEYTKMYGPITMDHPDNDLSSWKWIENPWPWEIGSEV